MKKLLAMLLSLAMLLVFVPATMADDADFTLAIEGGWVNRNLVEVDGEKLLAVDVTLSGTTAELVCGLNFALTYDTDQLTLVTHEENEALGMIMYNDTVAGCFGLAVATETSIAIADEMNVATLYFRVAENLESGTEIALALAENAYVETGDPNAPVVHGVAADFEPFVCYDAEFSLVIHGGEVKDHLVELERLPEGDDRLLAVEVGLRSTVEEALCSLVFELTYDTAQLTFVNFAANEAFGTTTVNANTAGKVRFASADGTGVAVSEEMNVVTLFFELSDALEVGDEIAFELEDGAYAETGNPAAPTAHGIEPDFTPYLFTEIPPIEPEVPEFDGTVSFNEGEVEYNGTTPWVIWDHDAGIHTPAFTVYDKDGGVVDPANYDYEYKENTMPGTGYLFVYFKNQYQGQVRLFFKIYLPATAKTTIENTADGILLTWEPVEDAAGYVIYRRAWSTTTDGWTAFARWDNTTELSYLDGHDDSHKVYAGTRYQYGVKAYFARRLDPIAGMEIGGNVNNDSGNFNLGKVGPLKTTVRITTRTLKSVTGGTKQMTVKWGPSKNFTGYQIRYAIHEDFSGSKTIKINDATVAKYIIENLKSGKTYYVQIRSYQLFEGMTYYGGWSNMLSCVVN